MPQKYTAPRGHIIVIIYRNGPEKNKKPGVN